MISPHHHISSDGQQDLDLENISEKMGTWSGAILDSS